MIKTSLIQLMHFSMITNYSNYICIWWSPCIIGLALKIAKTKIRKKTHFRGRVLQGFLEITIPKRYRSSNHRCSTKRLLLKSSPYLQKNMWVSFLIFFFFIGIHSMQGWTATRRHGVTRKRITKRLKLTENLFRKNLQVKDVC